MSTPLVSIIVPVYNAEKYLFRCVDSIINQSLKDIEILLIDDGSTDSSGKICDAYADKDARVKVFHRANQGVAATRQFGLEHITGQYVIHTDSDDWVDLNMYEKMYETAIDTNADVVFCDYFEEYGNKSQRVIQKPSSNNSSQVLVELFSFLHCACWNKLVLADTIRKFNVNFLEGFNVCEDMLFFMRLFQNPIISAYCPNVAYHYDLYSNIVSYTHSSIPIDVPRQVKFIQKLREFQRTEDISNGILGLETHVAYQAIKAKTYTKQEFFSVFSQLDNANILSHPGCPSSWKWIVWSAFRINYSTARFLINCKTFYRKRIKGIK